MFDSAEASFDRVKLLLHKTIAVTGHPENLKTIGPMPTEPGIFQAWRFIFSKKAGIDLASSLGMTKDRPSHSS